jgi:hypothetical protein
MRQKNYQKSLLCGLISQTSTEKRPKNGGVRKAIWVYFRLFWGNEGICDLFTEARSAEVNKHISPRCLKITYLFITLRGRVNESE